MTEASLESSEFKQKSNKYKTAFYLNAMNENEKLLNHKIIRNMNKRINFLKNPRYVDEIPTITIKSTIEKPNVLQPINHQGSPFRVIPREVVFTDYMINCVYEIEVALTNVSDKLRRIKCLPPALPEFSITDIKYPLGNSCIAPGMSARLGVRFHASALSVFDDSITVITEEDAFQIAVKARKESPKMTLPAIMDCLSCWVGDRVDMVFRTVNKGGDGGFRFFCEKEEDDLKQTGETIKLNNFTIFPAEFYAQKNQTQEIFVNFQPSKEGIIEENVLLACDNLTNATYVLKGQANMVELSIVSLDGNQIKFHEMELKTLYFEDAIPKKTLSRTVTIKNLTRVKVKYHWSLYKNSNKDNKLNLSENETHTFQVNPKQGIFDSEAEITFKLEFMGDQPFLYYEYACLIIDDVPVEAIRNPPETIKALLQEKQGPGFIGSNLSRPSITYYEMELVGNVRFCSLEINPPFYVYPDDLYFKKEYRKTFVIRNLSDIGVNYNCKLHWKSDDSINCAIENNAKGSIEKNSQVEIAVVFSSSMIGDNKKMTFILENEYGNPLSFEIIANFVGPKVKFNSPRINFGLIKAGCSGEFKLEVQNLSDIPASLLFRNTKSQKINFSIFPDPSENKPTSSQTFSDIPLDPDQKIFFEPQFFSLAPLQNRKITVTYKSQEPETVRELIECLVRDGDSLIIELFAEIQNTHLSLTRFKMDFECLYAGNIYEIASMHPQQIKLQNLGNIPTKFKWESINKPNVQINFDPCEGTIQPKSDLPIKVLIKPLLGGKLEELLICDCEGLEYPLGFEINTQVYGLSVEMEQLEDEDGKVLTKIERQFKSKKISLNEETEEAEQKKEGKHAKFNEPGKTQDSFNMTSSRKMSVASSKKGTIRKSTLGGTRRRTTKLSTSKKGKGQEMSSSMLDDTVEILINPKLEKLEFIHCKINQAKQAKFLIKNTSGINTNFKISAEKFEPIFYKTVSPLKSPKKTVNIKNTTLKSSIRSSIRKTSFKQEMIAEKCPVLLTDKLEKTDNFISEAGKALNQERKLSKDQKFFLQNNKGIAVVCEPNQGNLDAYQEVEVVVTVFNDICGTYDDTLTIEIKGLEPYKFPVLINVKGSPIIVTPNQVGVSFKAEYPEVNIGNVLRNQGPTLKKFKVSNTGPKDMEIEWKIYEFSNDLYQNMDFFQLNFGAAFPGTEEVTHLEWVPIKPPPSEDPQVSIEPKKAVIQGRKMETFNLTFTSKNIGDYKAILIAEPRLSSQEQKLESSMLQDLVVSVQAFSIQPKLHLDKAAQLDGSMTISFEKWSFMDSTKETRAICLVNQFRTNLVFNLTVEGPFKILSTYTNSPLKYELGTNSHCYNLAENTNLELKIGFQGPKANETNMWPLTQRMYQTGNLIINFSNGDSQNITLKAELLRPILSINNTGFEGKEESNELRDFGTVHIKNFKTLSLFLVNKTKVPGKWKLLYVKFPQKGLVGFATKTKLEFENENKTDDPTVFEFSRTEGVLNGPSIPMNCVPYGKALPSEYTHDDNSMKNINPEGILINFRPKKNILYKCRYKIFVEEGNILEFELKGMGTYDESLEK